MSFSEILQAKIEARGLNGSAIRAAADALRQQAFERIRPVHEAVATMVGRLAEDSVFAAGFGVVPKLGFKWSADNPTISSVTVDGPAGSFMVQIAFRPGLLDRQPQIMPKGGGSATHLGPPDIDIFSTSDRIGTLGRGRKSLQQYADSSELVLAFGQTTDRRRFPTMRSAPPRL